MLQIIICPSVFGRELQGRNGVMTPSFHRIKWFYHFLVACISLTSWSLRMGKCSMLHGTDASITSSPRSQLLFGDLIARGVECGLTMSSPYITIQGDVHRIGTSWTSTELETMTPATGAMFAFFHWRYNLNSDSLWHVRNWYSYLSCTHLITDRRYIRAVWHA